MRLIRRRRKPNTAQKALGYVRTSAKLLVAQRVARRAFKGFKFSRRVAPLAALAGIGLLAKKKLSRRQEAVYEPGPVDAPAPATPTDDLGRAGEEGAPTDTSSAAELDVEGPNESAPGHEPAQRGSST
jgi:hypothetical protein